MIPIISLILKYAGVAQELAVLKETVEKAFRNQTVISFSPYHIDRLNNILLKFVREHGCEAYTLSVDKNAVTLTIKGNDLVEYENFFTLHGLTPLKRNNHEKN